MHGRRAYTATQLCLASALSCVPLSPNLCPSIPLIDICCYKKNHKKTHKKIEKTIKKPLQKIDKIQENTKKRGSSVCSSTSSFLFIPQLSTFLFLMRTLLNVLAMVSLEFNIDNIFFILQRSCPDIKASHLFA